jgi:hypothetical protein
VIWSLRAKLDCPTVPLFDNSMNKRLPISTQPKSQYIALLLDTSLSTEGASTTFALQEFPGSYVHRIAQWLSSDSPSLV